MPSLTLKRRPFSLVTFLAIVLATCGSYFISLLAAIALCSLVNGHRLMLDWMVVASPVITIILCGSATRAFYKSNWLVPSISSALISCGVVLWICAYILPTMNYVDSWRFALWWTGGLLVGCCAIPNPPRRLAIMVFAGGLLTIVVAIVLCMVRGSILPVVSCLR
jgi:hypothetical protein